MAEAKKTNYGNESISSLKGADRVRKRPGVIFGSDGLDGCEHAVFEILSNSIDEAREGHGKLITVTRYLDHSIEVEDMGRGCPVDYNPKEKRFNWELVYCELYAGGKYNNLDGDNYEYSLGLNGLGACATQYSSRYMDVTVWRDGNKYSLHFERGEPVGKKGDELRIEPTDRGRKTGTRTRWLPDLDVFTDIDIPTDYYVDTLRRQAVVNAGITFRLKNEVLPGRFETQDFLYENGIIDYVAEIAGEEGLTTPVFWETERRGRDREDKPEYKVKLSCACCFSNKVQRIEHYHNSSWLEHGGSPEHAVRTAFVYQINKYLKDKNLYKKGESAISFQDVQDCLVYVSSSFSTRTSYENQTKKAITNKFVSQAMTDFLKHYLEVYFLEKPEEAQKICQQVLVNKQSREHAEKTRQSIKKTLSTQIDLANRVQKFVDCRTKDASRRELYIVEGDSAMGAVKQSRDSEYQAIMPIRGKILNCLKADYARIFKSDVIVDLIKVMGCGVELGGKHNKELATFNIDNLRYNKIVICTDADVDGAHIRTLLLTLFYRQMPQLIENGHVYIAQPPLYKVKKNQADKGVFLKDEREMSDYLLKIAMEDARLYRNKDAFDADTPVRGSELETLVNEYLQSSDVIARLQGVIDKSVLVAIAAGVDINLENEFTSHHTAEVLQQELRDPNVKVEAVYDEENEKHLLKVHRLKHGNYKTTNVTPEFTLSADYRKLQESAAMLRGIIGTGARVARGKNDQAVKNFGEAVNWLLKQAEKGIIRQRYKGLGEMTAEQLNLTTMDPSVRRMLRVRIEDAASADAIFSMLMGDVVEPRRDFIETNALFAGNIDA